MGIKEKDIKMLWGRAASRCSICRRQLTADTKDDGSYTRGAQAHIVGESVGGPRGISNLSDAERNCYSNLILLCPNDHTEIDINVSEWTTEKLHLIKSAHEQYVSETMASAGSLEKLIFEESFTTLLDEIVVACRMDQWELWVGNAMAPDQFYEQKMQREIWRVKRKVYAFAWPEKGKELQLAANFFIFCVDKFFYELGKNSTDRFRNQSSKDDTDPKKAYRFYREADGTEEHYLILLNRFDAWQRRCTRAGWRAIRAANWFADAVRKDINPRFYACKRFSDGDEPDFQNLGKLVFTEGQKEKYRKFHEGI